jgi:hypothetical protein
MARRTVATVAATYTVVDAERLDAGALVIARLVDAASGRPLATARGHTEHPHASVQVASSGHLVVIGRADLVLPRLATANETIVVELERPGQPPELLSLLVPMGSPLPLELPDIAIEAPPLAIAGTVTSAAHPHGPVADALVRVALPAAGPPFALALRTPVARSHPPASTIRARDLNPVTATTLAEPAVGGDATTTVVVAAVAGCAPGRVLALGPPLGPPSDVEHLVIGAVDGPTATVTLRTPLVRSRPAGTAASVFTLGAAGPASALDGEVRSHDGIVLTAADLAQEDAVEIVDPDPLRNEVRATHARSDADGRFRVPGVRGLERLALTPEGPAPPPGPTVTVLLDPVFDPVRADLIL